MPPFKAPPPQPMHQQQTYMIGACQSNGSNPELASQMASEQPNMINYFLRSNSPHSPLGSSVAGNNFGSLNSQSPISNSPASNSNALQQFSPFISEDDSSEINDISPSPIGSCGKYKFFFFFFFVRFIQTCAPEKLEGLGLGLGFFNKLVSAQLYMG